VAERKEGGPGNAYKSGLKVLSKGKSKKKRKEDLGEVEGGRLRYGAKHVLFVGGVVSTKRVEEWGEIKTDGKMETDTMPKHQGQTRKVNVGKK